MSVDASGAVLRLQQLLNVTAFGWYAFGGGWGQVGKVEFTTGPLGPGWKEALPAEWLGGLRRSPHRCSS
jgi:hypothetical protein